MLRIICWFVTPENIIEVLERLTTRMREYHEAKDRERMQYEALAVEAGEASERAKRIMRGLDVIG